MKSSKSQAPNFKPQARADVSGPECRRPQPGGLMELSRGHRPRTQGREAFLPRRGGGTRWLSSSVSVAPPGRMFYLELNPGALPPAKFHWPSGPKRHCHHVSHPRHLRATPLCVLCALSRLNND